MKRVLFRADAKPSIGIGDLMSLIHLSQYFKEDGWDNHFMIRGYPAGRRLVEKYRDNQTFILAPHCSLSDEIKAINEYAENHSIDLVFFEITERKLSDYENLSDAFKKACVCFDGHILKNMSLVVDWDVEAPKFFSPGDHPNTTFLLGPENVILPKIFYTNSRIAARDFNSGVKQILIAMGGADQDNFTATISEFILRKRPELYLNIVVGSGYQDVEALDRRLSKYSSNYIIKHNVDNMLDEYLMVDMAIGAGGLTSSELVATRTPCLLVATVQHQIARCEFFHDLGLAVYLGYRSFDKAMILKYLEQPLTVQTQLSFNTPRILEVCNGIV